MGTMEREGDTIGPPFFELIGAVVPNSDAPCTIFTFWNCPLELSEIQVMIFYLNR